MESEYIKNIEDIEKEVFKIFSEVTSVSEISLYKSELLQMKLYLLEQSVIKNLDSLVQLANEKSNKNKLVAKILLLIQLGSLVLMPINPTIGLTINLVCCISRIKLINDLSKNVKSNEYQNAFERKLDDLHTTFENCYTFINAKTNPNIEYLDDELENEDLRKISIANQELEIRLVTGTVDDVPEDIKNIMIMMLQDVLQTNETDINKLIEMARCEMHAKLSEEGQKLIQHKKDEE